MYADLQDLYENVLVEYQSGFNPPQMIPKQVTPKDAGNKLSYNKQTIGMAPALVTSTVYGEQEEDIEKLFKIISDVESEYKGDSPINNAVKLALGKIKQKMNYE
jgi:hypothetical protein